MLTGDNGLLTKAAEAKKKTIVGQEKEQIELAYISAALKNIEGDVTAQNLQDELNESVGNNKTVVSGSSTLKVIFKDTNNEYTVTSDGNVTKHDSSTPTDIYVAVCSNGTLIFSNNEANINTYMSNNSTSLYTGWTGIENITNEEFYINYDERTGTETHNLPKWYGYDPNNDWNFTSYSTDITTAVFLNKIVPTSTSCSQWFGGLCNLSSISGLNNLDTSNVTDMSDMFSWCISLTEIDFTGFDTSNVTNMSGMFNECYNLTNLNLNSFDTSKVTDMSHMFNNCGKLASIELSNFDTSNVTDMQFMFSGCYMLTDLNISNFVTNNVTTFHGMFTSCEKLTYLDLTGFNTTKAIDMRQMFSNCELLTTLDLHSFDTSTVNYMDTMFKDCSGLTTIYVSNKFVTTNVQNNSDMFSGCTSLVGGNGSTLNSIYAINSYGYTGKVYAVIDTASTPGYFTLKEN